jgi:iron complex transport system substrate-binding protein
MGNISGIVSLLPSATEMLYALGLEESVVAVSHECDYPKAAQSKPRATLSCIDSAQSSLDIDVAVQEKLSTGQPLYELNVPLLRELDFDLIITQSKCKVCAVKYEDVVAAMDQIGRKEQVSILGLHPNSLEDVFNDLIRIGRACGIVESGEIAVRKYRQRVDTVVDRLRYLEQEQQPRTAMIEWIDPIMLAGNWMPELLKLGGGRGPKLDASGKSLFTTWNKISKFDPQVVVLCPCGFDLERTLDEVKYLENIPEFLSLQAVTNGFVYAVDGNAYFNRSGPRLVESLEILAHLLHPQKIPPPELSSSTETAWRKIG